MALLHGEEQKHRPDGWGEHTSVESKWFQGRSRKLLARERRKAEAKRKKMLEQEPDLKEADLPELVETDFFSTGYSDPTPALYCIQRTRRCSHRPRGEPLLTVAHAAARVCSG